MPETRYSIVRKGLFMSEASGISIATLVQWGRDPDVMQEVLTNRINSTQVPWWHLYSIKFLTAIDCVQDLV